MTLLEIFSNAMFEIFKGIEKIELKEITAEEWYTNDYQDIIENTSMLLKNGSKSDDLELAEYFANGYIRILNKSKILIEQNVSYDEIIKQIFIPHCDSVKKKMIQLKGQTFN